MKSPLFQVIVISFFLFGSAFTQADNNNGDIEVSIEEVSDKRTTGQHFDGLEITLLLKGYDLENAAGFLPAKLEKAKSDFGRRLIKSEESETALFFSFSKADGDPGETRRLELKNPRRKAETVFIKGYVPVVFHTDDPDVRLEVDDFLSKAAKPLKAPELEERGIEVTYYTKEQMKKRQEEMQAIKDRAEKQDKEPEEELAEVMGELFTEAFGSFFGFSGEYDLNFVIDDPDNEILRIALYDESGELLETGMRSASMHSDEPGRAGFDYKGGLPDKGTLVFLFKDERLIRKVPFEKTVKLP